jgi:hypothetical protein
VCDVSQLVSQLLFMFEDSLWFMMFFCGGTLVLAGTQACTAR